MEKHITIVDKTIKANIQYMPLLHHTLAVSDHAGINYLVQYL